MSSVGGRALTFSGKTNYFKTFLIVAIYLTCYFFWSRLQGILLITLRRFIILYFEKGWLYFLFCGLYSLCFSEAMLKIINYFEFTCNIKLSFWIFVVWSSTGNPASMKISKSIKAWFLLSECLNLYLAVLECMVVCM